MAGFSALYPGALQPSAVEGVGSVYTAYKRAQGLQLENCDSSLGHHLLLWDIEQINPFTYQASVPHLKNLRESGTLKTINVSSHSFYFPLHCPHTLLSLLSSHVASPDPGSAMAGGCWGPRERAPCPICSSIACLQPRTQCPMLPFTHLPSTHQRQPRWVGSMAATHSLKSDGAGTNNDVFQHLLTLTPQSTCP